MKRSFQQISALLLILCLLLGLAACSAGTPAAVRSTAAGTARPTSAPESGAGKNDVSAAAPDVEAEPEAAADGKPELAYPAGPEDIIYGGKGADDTGASYAPAPGEVAAGEGRTDSGKPIVIDDPLPPDDDPIPEPSHSGEALKLTAAEWKDNGNWPFFTNLVNGGKITFPSFGIDPRHRIKVTVTDAAGSPLANERVELMEGEALLWTARSDKDGAAYLFFTEAQRPDRVVSGEAEAPLQVELSGGDAQNPAVVKPVEDLSLVKTPEAPAQTGLQVMFIVDTTGSMDDELAYLQKDFSAIAQRVGSEGVRYAVSFYRDQGDVYVTRHNAFTSDVAELQRKLNAEYADGGGDLPEAVAEVLTECLTEREDWDESCVKLAFLIFDAPPHEGREAELLAAVKAAAGKGVRLVPVVASNADRNTELFGRALAICTGGTYVFLTNDSGVGESHLEPIVGSYTVELLQDLIVRVIEDYRP